MLIKKFENVLSYDTVKTVQGANKLELLQSIAFKEFEKSQGTMEKIREAGLEKYIGDKVEVEDKYTIRKILGYGATSVVYKADFTPITCPKQVKIGN